MFEPLYPEIDEAFNTRQDWSDFYEIERDCIPTNAPEPLGKKFIIRAYVDASYAGCKLTCQ